ncbi:MAG: HAMP domain-containing histidine kinase [Elusimicrobia bacterium]|nr:HAMP domain-containing histidine kinase [Elusimicrobiota bacterium]
MRLPLKLTLGLAVIVTGTLGIFVEAGHRSFHREAALRQERALLTAWENVARLAADAVGPERRVELLRAASEVAGPGALEESLLLDAQGRIGARVGFTPGGRETVGARASRPYLLSALEHPGTLRQAVAGPRRLRIYSVAVDAGGRRVGTVVAAYREEALEEELAWIRDSARRRLALAGILGFAVALLASAALSASLLRPLGRLAEAARRVGAGELGHRLPASSADELGVLSREFNKMTSRLAELDELKAGFVAQVTHDLRSPLHGMLGQADVLLGGYEGPLTPKQQEAMRSLLRSGKDLAALIDAILEVARLEAGKAPLEPGPVDVSEALGDALTAARGEAETLGVSLAVHVQPGLEFVNADAAALRRVLANLVSNALKFTPSGGQVNVSARKDGSTHAIFSVADTGVGIPENRIASLFAKFSQVPETRRHARGHPGSGLGLAICRELVLAHGGRIWVESKPGEGARFSFTLPLGDHSK